MMRGYGHIAPKTDWGKVVTIFYAIPGVPLMMLCLANIGDGMAHSFRFLYWKVCCYACTKRPKKRRRGRSTRSSRRYPSTSGGSRTRTSSFRRSKRASEKSADSHLSDSAFYTSSYSDPDYKEREGREAREGSRRSRRDEEADLPVTHQPRGSHRGPPPNPDYNDSPPMPRSPRTSDRYQRHLSPPHDPRSRMSRMDEDYYYDDYDDYDDEEEEDDMGDKPVPIWLGVMLVKEKDNVELSIALCSIYLLFGIALLAMSFNLVQEEVISNVKSMARRLGILKDEEEEEDLD
ncbi:Potassium channel subfamily K member 9 [Portunus trituberculatus]|uniref:Potassium channel subfamily K member 9 n=1 Tax=Portunus trituberculatus TaxID=210409 RepID=A0A5B7D8I3_PORTR|nr:Potassium channel subfamily K member 9 [Portunus trituberculatus]